MAQEKYLTDKQLRINYLVAQLQKGRELYPQDKGLQKELEDIGDKSLSERTLRRYLNQILGARNSMIVIEKKQKEFSDRTVEVFRATGKKEASDVMKFFMQEGTDLEWVVEMLQEQDPLLLNDLKPDVKEAVENLLKKNEGVFLFRHRPLEIFTEKKEKRIFDTLKEAVKEHRYFSWKRNDKYNPEINNAKCLKIVYMQNNWYVALEKENGEFKLERISKIEEVYPSVKDRYSSDDLIKYLSFFDNLSDAHMKYGVNPKIAILCIDAAKAEYFEEGKKLYFPTQKFMSRNEDGSIKFSVEYTHPNEVLPFVKRFIPYIQILTPASLNKIFQNDMKKSIEIIHQRAKLSKEEKKKVYERKITIRES